MMVTVMVPMPMPMPMLTLVPVGCLLGRRWWCGRFRGGVRRRCGRRRGGWAGIWPVVGMWMRWLWLMVWRRGGRISRIGL